MEDFSSRQVKILIFLQLTVNAVENIEGKSAECRDMAEGGGKEGWGEKCE